MSSLVKVEKLEEHWTPTTVQGIFAVRLSSSKNSLISSPKSSNLSIDLPLSNFGWTFTLSLSELVSMRIKQKKATKSTVSTAYDWTPVTFSFRQDDSSIPWGDTFLQAQLSLALKQPDSADTLRPDYEEEYSPQHSINHDPMPIGTMQVALSRNSSVVLPLKTTGFISLCQPTKIRLNLSISECPLDSGLFQTPRSPSDEVNAEAHTQLVRQCGDRLLTQSLATGKLFDVKFLTSSTRNGKIELCPTYASLLVLGQKIDLSSSKLGDEWKGALSTPKRDDEVDLGHAGEISCPDGYGYELDSDFDDEDDVSPVEPCAPPSDTEGGPNNTHRDQQPQPECGSVGSNSSMSSWLHQPEEIIQGSAEPHHIDDDECQRTITVKFAAHRTWRAFLWYCYTDHVEFSQLKSQVQHSGRHPDIEDGAPPCSPKSMYRLADLVGNKDLKEKALEAISERMNKKNILEETFSVFTSKYPDIRQAQVHILLKHIGSRKVKDSFVDMMKNFGDMPHAAPVLLALCDSLAKVPAEGIGSNRQLRMCF